jgi:hypothetical protein
MPEANLEPLNPRDAVLPMNPMYTAQEWQEIYAKPKLSPEDPPNFKQGTEPQQGNTCVTYSRSVHENFQLFK